MKKKIISAFIALTIFVLIMIASAKAQGGLRVGIGGGYGLTNIFDEELDNSSEVKKVLSFGWHGGLVTGYNFERVNLGFTLDFLLKQYTQKRQEAGVAPKWKLETDLRYLEIPFLIRLRPAGNKRTGFTLGGPYLEVGIQPAFLLRAMQEVKDSSGAQITDVKDWFEDFNLSAIIGVGFHQFATHEWAVTHGFRLSYGLMEIRRQTKTISIISYLLVIGYKPGGKNKRQWY